MVSNKNTMDLSDEEDDNPYDFVAQYRSESILYLCVLI